MTTESREFLQKLVSEMSSELVNAKARIRELERQLAEEQSFHRLTADVLAETEQRRKELESITACAPGEIENLPTPKCDAADDEFNKDTNRYSNDLEGAYSEAIDESILWESIARTLERSEAFLTARLIEVRRDHLAYEAKQAAEIRELKGCLREMMDIKPNNAVVVRRIVETAKRLTL